MGAQCSPACCADEGEVDDTVALSSLSQGEGLGVYHEARRSPRGQIFDETVGHLPALDRNLLCFCATSSLVAVRWLLHLGASPEARDSNSSTGLHIACRSGSLPVVGELLRLPALLDTLDIAGWTPLHIAANMGRREAVRQLLEARADPLRANARNRVAAELCMEEGCLGLLGSRDPELRQLGAPEDTFSVSDNCAPDRADDTAGISISCEPEMVFVAPGPAIQLEDSQKREVLSIGLQLFALQPSYALSFVVATGLFGSYTDATKILLRHAASDGRHRALVGGLLGEAFSICPLLRFSVFDGVPLFNTGVVSALTRAFAQFQLPLDLQKLDRLTRGVAQVWWRKHRGMADQSLGPPEPGADAAGGAGELVGLGLWQFLGSWDVLQQLMLSTLLLHWHLHSSDPLLAGRRLSLEDWLELNRGIETKGGNVPEHVQRRIHALVSVGYIKELALGPGELPSNRAGVSSLSKLASTECWVQVDGDLPFNLDALGEDTFSEANAAGPSAAASRSPPAGSQGDGDSLFNAAPAAPPPPRRREDNNFWASICSRFLFFSTGPPADAATVPHAFLDTSTVQVSRVADKTRIISLAGRGRGAAMKFVLLLPDGRWQELPMQRLDLRMQSDAALQEWSGRLSDAA